MVHFSGEGKCPHLFVLLLLLLLLFFPPYNALVVASSRFFEMAFVVVVVADFSSFQTNPRQRLTVPLPGTNPLRPQRGQLQPQVGYTRDHIPGHF